MAYGGILLRGDGTYLCAQPPTCRLAFWILMFPPARCFRMKKSPMSLLLGSEIENDSRDRLRITHVTFVGSAYTARTHFTSRPSSFAMLVSARGILEIRCEMWTCLILNAVVVTGPACSPRPARSSVQSRDVGFFSRRL